MAAVHEAIAKRLSSLGRDFARGYEAFDREGPEIRVRPFAPGTVTPEAGVLKVLTRLAAVRQARTNLRAKRESEGLSRYRQALQVKDLEGRLSEPKYEIDVGGQKVGGLTGSQYVTAWRAMQQKDPATDLVDLSPDDASLLGLAASPTGKYDRQSVLAAQANRRIRDRLAVHADVERRAGEAKASRSKYAAAVAGIRQIESEEEAGANQLWQSIQPEIQKHLAVIADKNQPAEARAASARGIGLAWIPGDPVYQQDLEAAVESLRKQTIARGKAEMRRRTAERRRRFTATIDAEGQTLLDAAPDADGLSPADREALEMLEGLGGVTN